MLCLLVGSLNLSLAHCLLFGGSWAQLARWLGGFIKPTGPFPKADQLSTGNLGKLYNHDVKTNSGIKSKNCSFQGGILILKSCGLRR